jgi:molybdopterin-guanine dinucleotide biosynthesis protein A
MLASSWTVDVFFSEWTCVSSQKMDDVNAFVLAGGRSSRMGTDKAFVVFNRQTLLEGSLARLSAVASGTWIVGSREKFGPFGNVVEDEFPDHGPLGGIHAALRASKADLNLVLAVDMPFVDVRFLKYLIAKAGAGKAVVTLPRAGGGWQPLCAVYRKRFSESAEMALRAGNNKIDPLFAQYEVQVLAEAELLKDGFSADMFRNVNTPEELTALGKGN